MPVSQVPGTQVRIPTDAGRVGVLTGKTRDRNGITFLEVVFPDRKQFVAHDRLEEVTPDGGDPLELLRSGRVAGPRDLRRVLTHTRLTGRLANVIYAMDTTGTDFYAYQFKPLLKLLNSATTGILVADEVGLGKTIEAGLIWTELRSRYDFDRLLVLCPAMLRTKWQQELRRRFGVRADIVDSAGLLDRLHSAASEPGRTPFALIASMQGSRPRRGWDDDDKPGGAASRLARFMAEQNEQPLIDLAIVDEAHYMRNPETMTSTLGRLVRGIAAHILLLSATPIHLRSRDLFQLVSLADPATFTRQQSFDELLSANAPLVKARDLVAGGRATSDELREALHAAASNPLLKGSRQLGALLDEVPSDNALRDPKVVSELAWRLDSVNLMGHVVSRTRKRDVHEWRVVRDPKPEAVPPSPPEQEFYSAVTQVVREYCARSAGHEGFLLVTPQRQMSSSMAAAYREWSERGTLSADALEEDQGDSSSEFQERPSDEPGPLVQQLIDRVRNLSDYETLRDNDSKYLRLRDELRSFFAEHPDDKVVLFSYFRATLAYLHERLAEDGIDSLVLHGNTEDRDEVIRDFRTSDSGTVLLASEVASEGVDLQFAWVIINYDLPWNPMRVEQRIGRLDRLGQKSPKVAIWNLFYDGTIDARIYRRLYERLGLFEGTLGGLEPILGEEIQNLTTDLLRKPLTPAQEDSRIEQTSLALENRRREEARLEGEAAHLVAYGDYIVDQVTTARELRRQIDSDDIRSYVCEFFADRYPGCEFQRDPDDDLYRVSLSNEARHNLETFLITRRLQGHTRLARSDARAVKCRFENTVAVGSGRLERINQLHPLVRFISEQYKDGEGALAPPAVAVSTRREGLPTSISPGTWVFSVQQWSMKGIRETEHLFYAACRLNGDGPDLEPEDAERLINVAAGFGQDWIGAESIVDMDRAYDIANDRCLAASDRAYDKRTGELHAQNEDRAQIQQRTLERHTAVQLSNLNEVLHKHENAGRAALAAATRGRIQALEDRVERKRREIAQRREFSSSSEEICVGILELLD